MAPKIPETAFWNFVSTTRFLEFFWNLMGLFWIAPSVMKGTRCTPRVMGGSTLGVRTPVGRVPRRLKGPRCSGGNPLLRANHPGAV